MASLKKNSLYLIHHICGIFHNAVLALENKTCASPDLYEIIENLIVGLNQKRQDNFYGYKANAALRRLNNATKANEIKCELEKFCERATTYIQKYFSLENSPFKVLKMFNLRTEFEWHTLETCVDSLKLEDHINVNELHNEFGILKKKMPELVEMNKSGVEKWMQLFAHGNFPNLLKIVQFVYSIPVSNAYCERVFSIMGNELQTKLNFDMSCMEFADFIKKYPAILSAAKSEKKYKFLNK
jgi:hypothetical protein